MELYIAKKNESLNDIAIKFNLTFEELVQFNKTYRNRLDLEDCPVLIPDYNRSNDNLKVVIPNIKINNLPILRSLITKYNHLLKEFIMSSFSFSGYEEILKTKIDEVEDKIKKMIANKKTSDVSKITSSMGYKNIVQIISDFIKAIKNHEVEPLKEELRNLKNWPKKISMLYSLDLKREDDLIKMFKNIVSFWRDYILNLATKEYKLAEKNFEDIENECMELSKELI